MVTSSTGAQIQEGSVYRYSPEHSALIVIDMQNDFCHPNGTMAHRGKDVGGADLATDKVLNLVQQARHIGVPVVFVRTFHDDHVDSPTWQHRFVDGLGAGYSPARPNCVTGSWGSEFYRVAPLPGEPVVTKNRYSAFSADEFSTVLAELGRLSLIFVGIATNVCVESSARDAVDHDFFASMVTDACAAYRADEHSAAIACFGEHFGATIATAELLSCWADADR